MVSEKVVDPNKINRSKTTPVMCVHGDIIFYPIAKGAAVGSEATRSRDDPYAPGIQAFSTNRNGSRGTTTTYPSR